MLIVLFPVDLRVGVVETFLVVDGGGAFILTPAFTLFNRSSMLTGGAISLGAAGGAEGGFNLTGLLIDVGIVLV